MTSPAAVAIAGVGAIACLGDDSASLYQNLCAGRSGLAPLRRFAPEQHLSGHAYEIDARDDAADGARNAGRWLARAIAEAIDTAGLDAAELPDIPVLVGTGLRELRSAELWWTGRAELSAADLHFGPALRKRFGFTEIHTLNNACSAALYALGLGCDLVTSGESEAVIVAGVDTITESMFGLLARASGQGVDRIRPFDVDRRGVLMGDGAAAVVLRRGGPARGWLRSVGLNCDAHHVTAPNRDGIAAAMREAFERAHLEPRDIDVVFAHGTGTALNDRVEAEVLSDHFDLPNAPLVTAIKSMIGHTSGASGLHSVAVALETLRQGVVPPIVGLRKPAAEASALRLCRTATPASDLRIAQVDAFGFGGVNAVALLEAAS
ncbi:beta-ketoacyl synthase N-terminal-like domain-containing protein [Nocardia sp. CA-135953]|uniref:beta-ketoacyl synthase N-terminal-like domain-containing protein n=1 Tax=Nocardia sp. CA-135953 TaxID=3239978 RepID=UPI003D975D5E